MFMTQAIPALWVYTSGDGYNRTDVQYAKFLTQDQQNRLERIRQARLIFDGHHRKYFLDENRSQFDIKPERIGGLWGDRTVLFYISYNLSRLVSIKNADLLFGDSPMLRVDAGFSAQEDALKALVDRSGLHSLFHAAATDCSYEAETFFEAILQDGQVYLARVPADEIFPIGPMRPDRQFARYDRYTLGNMGTDKLPLYILLNQIYTAGQIERHLYQLDSKLDLMGEIDLDTWANTQGGPPLQPLTKTGIALNTITYVPNLLSRGVPVSDYDGSIDLQDTLNAKNTQLARVIQQHSDPKLAVPTRTANELGGVRSDHQVFFFDSKEEIPQYLTWNAELQAALADRDFAENALLITQEMSPVLLGISKGGSTHAQSYKTVRLQSYNSITKAARKAAYWKDAIKLAIAVCQQMEQTLPGVRYDTAPIGVELKDGIPVDDNDQATRQATLRGAGLISVHRALEEQLGDPSAVAAEEAELEKENAAKQPSIVLSEPSGPAAEPLGSGSAEPLPGVQPKDGQPITGSEEEAAAKAAASDQSEVAA